MAFVPAAKTALVELVYAWDAQPVENTIFLRHLDPITLPVLQALGASVFDWWDANVQALQSVDVELTEVSCTDMTTATGPFYSFTAGLPLQGGVAEEAVPANVAPCISFRTGSRGRSFRGRNYLIG